MNLEKTAKRFLTPRNIIIFSVLFVFLVNGIFSYKEIMSGSVTNHDMWAHLYVFNHPETIFASKDPIANVANIHPPVYYILFYPLHFLGAPDTLLPVLIRFMLPLMILLPLYKLALLLTENKLTSSLSVFFMSTTPLNGAIHGIYFPMPSVLAVSFVLSSVYFLLKAKKENSAAGFFVSGVFASLSLLTHTVAAIALSAFLFIEFCTLVYSGKLRLNFFIILIPMIPAFLYYLSILPAFMEYSSSGSGILYLFPQDKYSLFTIEKIATYLGIIPISMGLLGIFHSLKKMKRKTNSFVLWLISLIIVSQLFLAGFYLVNHRFLLYATIPLSVFASIGLAGVFVPLLRKGGNFSYLLFFSLIGIFCLMQPIYAATFSYHPDVSQEMMESVELSKEIIQSEDLVYALNYRYYVYATNHKKTHYTYPSNESAYINEVIMTSRDKDELTDVIKNYKIDYIFLVTKERAKELKEILGSMLEYKIEGEWPLLYVKGF
jgi:hypothetical protein